MCLQKAYLGIHSNIFNISYYRTRIPISINYHGVNKLDLDITTANIVLDSNSALLIFFASLFSVSSKLLLLLSLYSIIFFFFKSNSCCSFSQQNIKESLLLLSLRLRESNNYSYNYMQLKEPYRNKAKVQYQNQFVDECGRKN